MRTWPVSTSLADTRSAELYRRALEVLPGGVNSPVRAMGAIGRSPIFVDRGEGAELIDVDGNRFIDYVCSWGPLIHGHAHPVVLDAVASAAAKGTSFGAPTAAEVELAVEVTRRIEGVDDAAHDLLGDRGDDDRRPARARGHRARAAAQVRRRLPRASRSAARAGGLRSCHPGAPLEPGCARRARPPARSWCPGTTPTRCAPPWSSRAGRHELAAIIAEPFPANMGLVPPRAGFLELLREHADACGALLILDEVITGFRVARGGAQELTGVRGDLTILGKVLGGGLPAAAVGRSRRADAPARPCRRGLPSRHALGQSARRRCRPRHALPARRARLPAPRIHHRSARRGPALGGRLRGRDPVQVVSVPGLLTVFFCDRPVLCFDDARACDLDAHAAWCRELLSRGVYPPPSQFEAWFPSLAHTPEHIERTVAVAAAAFAELP